MILDILDVVTMKDSRESRLKVKNLDLVPTKYYSYNEGF